MRGRGSETARARGCRRIRCRDPAGRQAHTNARQIFNRFQAPRSIEASKSVESKLKIDLVRQKSTNRDATSSLCKSSLAAREIPRKCEARQQKYVRSPKIAMRRFQLANIEQVLYVTCDRFGAPRSIERSKFVESALKNPCAPQRRNHRRVA